MHHRIPMSPPTDRDLVATYEERLLEGDDVLRRARLEGDHARALRIDAAALREAAARIGWPTWCPVMGEMLANLGWMLEYRCSVSNQKYWRDKIL